MSFQRAQSLHPRRTICNARQEIALAASKTVPSGTTSLISPQFAASAAPYNRWFKDSLKEFFPPFIDFDQPVPANETVWDWTRS